MKPLHVDYIIVGQGLAGSAIIQELIAHKKTFVVIDQREASHASRIASGIWNPLVLKRMKRVWQAEQMLHYLPSFYKETEVLFHASVIKQEKVHRAFASAKEVDEWLMYCDQPQFTNVLDHTIKRNLAAGVHTPYGVGRVKESGRIDTNAWLAAVRDYLKTNDKLIEELFDHQQLESSNNSVCYKHINAKGIIFCEGMHTALLNPYFAHLPFALTKGEVLTIHSEALQLKEILNSSVFILPLGNNLYKVGATYSWDDYTTEPTQHARETLLEKATKIITVPFTVVNHEAGIRPTIRDRKPLLGTHHSIKTVHIFNGMGSRGVLMAPWLAHAFINYLENGIALPAEADIKRFS